MSIDSHIIETHVFSQKRRGYDPAEVDAVVARLTDALDSRERALESALATVRSLEDDLQAEPDADQLEAAREAARILETAEEQAETLLKAARGRADTYERAANALFAKAEAADRDLVSEIEEAVGATASEQADILEEAAQEAETLLRDTEIEAQRRAREIIQDAIVESESMLEEAETGAAARVSAARMHAEAVLRQARAEAEDLIIGVQADIERERTKAATAIAAMATAVAAPMVVDLTDPVPDDALEVPPQESPLVRQRTQSVIVLKPDGVTIDLHDKSFADPIAELVAHRHYSFAIPDGSGALPATRALLNSDIVTSNTRRIPDGTEAGRATIYQRRGLGIRSRLSLLNES